MSVYTDSFLEIWRRESERLLKLPRACRLIECLRLIGRGLQCQWTNT